MTSNLPVGPITISVFPELEPFERGGPFFFSENHYLTPLWCIEVASVINRKGLARAGSWFNQIYLPAIDTIVTGMLCTANVL